MSILSGDATTEPFPDALPHRREARFGGAGPGDLLGVSLIELLFSPASVPSAAACSNAPPVHGHAAARQRARGVCWAQHPSKLELEHEAHSALTHISGAPVPQVVVNDHHRASAAGKRTLAGVPMAAWDTLTQLFIREPGAAKRCLLHQLLVLVTVEVLAPRKNTCGPQRHRGVLREVKRHEPIRPGIAWMPMAPKGVPMPKLPRPARLAGVAEAVRVHDVAGP
mmetsp:Transcript_222/g.706  ORF Transcript_222/g.706 Transcript_222/m.706 type:complete len:224 (+) Transcript_222:65-736(+)